MIIQELIANFWRNGKALHEEHLFNAALKLLLIEVRKTLDDSSPLAKSIDRNDPSEILFKISKEENFVELAEILHIDSGQGNRKGERRLAINQRKKDQRKVNRSVEINLRKFTRRKSGRRDPWKVRRTRDSPLEPL